MDSIEVRKSGQTSVRALVAFGSKYGSTARVAEEIADVLRKKEIDVTVLDLRKSRHSRIDGYDLIVVGSSIIMDKWSKKALAFLETHGRILLTKNVALFVCSANMYTNPEKTDMYRKMYLDDIAERYGIPGKIPKGLFGGEIDFGRFGFLTKAMVNSMMRDKLQGIDLGRPFDFRDWNAIRSWADSLEMM